MKKGGETKTERIIIALQYKPMAHLWLKYCATLLENKIKQN